ncbi:MAG: S8 family serine peptidase, partial [Candidatus Marinimicrobia bacterium]|nr:S8 family serine peptidase [Candidatus Neomarinimicrobiota bacterium]
MVDGGTDWGHVDLEANVWINTADTTINGIDDDDNGYVDDVRGWNFVRDNGDPSGLTTAPVNASHGTEVAGVASAVTNNGIGIAGASWNAQLMLVNVSCASDTLICYGVEGIVYAAVNGADIISLSWGSSHPDLSSFEERSLLKFWDDVSDFAAENGALLVAAAGNGNVLNDEALHTPASGRHILSVGATNKSSDVRAGFSNYGVTVDVFAPGTNLNSTLPDDAYTNESSGTSFSTPLVSGMAALVKTIFQTYTPEQLAQKMRVTADNIDGVNSGLVGLMGKGRINAFRAVTDTSTPAIRIAGVSFIDSGGDGFIENGETVDVTVSLVNYLADATDVAVTLTQADPNVTITIGGATIAFLASGDTAGVTFRFTLDQAGPGQPLPFVVELTAGSYQDRDLFKLYANEPLIAIHDTGPIQVALTSEGNIGWIGFAYESPGVGFIYKGTNLLFEGGLMVGISKNKVSDSVRGEGAARDQDFQMPPGGQLLLGPGQSANEEGAVVLIDDLASSPIGLLILQESFADNNAAYDDFVIFRYVITNKSGGPLWNLYAGLFFDWDISENGQTDYGRFDDARRMGVVQNSGAAPTILAATKLLTESGGLS